MTQPLTGLALEKLLQEATIVTLIGDAEVRLVVLENQDYRLLVLNGAVQSVQDKRQPARLVLAHQHLLLAELSQLPPQAKVLELGLGGGSALAHAQVYFPQLNWLCVEQSAQVISLYFDYFAPEIRATNHRIVQANAYQWLTQQRQHDVFDLVLCDVYEQLDAHFLTACAAAVKPGGTLAVNWLPHLQNDQLGGQEFDACLAVQGWSRSQKKVPGFRNQIFYLTCPSD